MDYAGFVERDPRSPIQLDDTRTAHALREVLVWRADNHLVDSCISIGRNRRGTESVVRLKFHHRPDDHAGRRQSLFQQRELGQQIGLDALAGFVSWPQSVAERFNHVIGRDGDVRGAAADHTQHRREYASDCTHFVAI